MVERFPYIMIICIYSFLVENCFAQDIVDLNSYNYYFGSTHAHTSNTWSHGIQYEKLPNFKRYMETDANGVSKSINTILKKNWQNLQGPASLHFKLARDNNYDFYIVTDHSQEEAFNPPDADNLYWLNEKKEAQNATDSDFVSLIGYEHSENNGPGATGHINVINSAEYLNALKSDVDLPYFYKWLETVPSNGEGPVVASFNHPGKEQYANWAYRDQNVTDIITMLEVINSNNKIHYEGFIAALDKGWKVSPVAGSDNHNITGIKENTSRTVIVAKEKTKKALLEAMKSRRTYATLDNNIHCIYSVNNNIMGSEIKHASSYDFNIIIQDPDIGNSKNKIIKVDIVKDNGTIVKTFKPIVPKYSLRWNIKIEDDFASYFFVRIWNAGGGDAPDSDSSKPIVWLAPIFVIN